MALGLGLLAAGCASSSPAEPGVASEEDRRRVTLYDYLGGQTFEIVSESYTNRVEYLSEKRSSANRKFLKDDALEAFLDYLDDEGLGTYGQAGRAPSSGRDVITRAFEVERDGALTSWAVGRGTENQEKISFTVLMSHFLQVYTEIPAFQAIENPEGHELFRDSERQKTGR